MVMILQFSFWWQEQVILLAARVTVIGSVSVCLISQISTLERLFILKILSHTQRATEVQKYVVFFLKTLCSKVMASFAYL